MDLQVHVPAEGRVKEGRTGHSKGKQDKLGEQGEVRLKKTCNRECDKRDKKTEKLFCLLNHQADSLLSGLEFVVPVLLQAGCQVDDKGGEADQDARQQPQQGEVGLIP